MPFQILVYPYFCGFIFHIIFVYTHMYIPLLSCLWYLVSIYNAHFIWLLLCRAKKKFFFLLIIVYSASSFFFRLPSFSSLCMKEICICGKHTHTHRQIPLYLIVKEDIYFFLCHDDDDDVPIVSFTHYLLLWFTILKVELWLHVGGYILFVLIYLIQACHL